MFKHFHFKLVLKIIIILVIIESIYLFCVPFFVNKIFENDNFKNKLNQNLKVNIEYNDLNIKTHFMPYLSLYAKNIKLKDKVENTVIFSSDNLNVELRLFSLIKKKINIKKISAEKLETYIVRNENGIFNFENYFEKKSEKSNLLYNSIKISVNNYNILINDKFINKSFNVYGDKFNLNSESKKIFVETIGECVNSYGKTSFDVDMELKQPVSLKDFKENLISGKVYIYNLDLSILLPYIQKFVDEKISVLSGNIDYFQISGEKVEKNKNNIVINTSFKDIVFDKANWTNHIEANGDNKVDANIDIYDRTIDVNSFRYRADKINIDVNGKAILSEKPELDLHGKIKDSRVENIASLLPPTLIPQYMTIEKIKNYGVYGDIDADITIKGNLPQPDIGGYVKGRNIKALDKKTQALHKASVDINFDKRKLNMDILVEMFNNQKAFIKGYTYMYRDAANNVTIKTTDKIDFPLAQKIVVPISKVFNFQLGPIPDMNITSGKGKLDVNIQGTIDYVNIYGYCYFNNARLTYNGLYGEVYDGKGRLDFKDDIIKIKSERAFVKGNSVDLSGVVKINDNLDINISTPKANAKDLLEVINKSKLLKDVKSGMLVITSADGLIDLFVNIKANIVPVPYGQPPLPPEEAFTDMKVKGNVDLYKGQCYLQGFYTPINDITGNADFTETIVNLNNIKGISGTSPIEINGKIITDINTKIPDVDITVTSDSVYLKDTIKFLTQSYLYPENYPDLSFLYDIDSKHDLYFKYKAKSVDFITDKAYAVMNVIEDDSDSQLKAVSGKVILDKSKVIVEDVFGKFFDSNIKISGNVEHVDTLNPLYNLKIQDENFDISNFNNIEKLNILPDEIKSIFKNFSDYNGNADIDITLKKNILNGIINFENLSFNHIKTGIPFKFDEFDINIKNNIALFKNMTALIGDMPIFLDISITNIYDKNPFVKGYFSSKFSNKFVKNYLPSDLSSKLNFIGDINLFSKIEGNINNLSIKPKITLYKEADISYNGTNVGDIYDEREFNGDIRLNGDLIHLNNINYIKYIASQNNKVYPLIMSSINGTMKLNENNIIEPLELNIKTSNNLSARLLNWFIGFPLFTQGTLNCDLSYKFDKYNNIAKLIGKLECRNIDLPFLDTIIKHIKIDSKNDDIDINLFGFITDGRLKIDSIIENNLLSIPKIKMLNIYAEQIDNNKLLEEFYKTRQSLNISSQKNNIDLSGLYIENGHLNIDKFTLKSLEANNFNTDFSIDNLGIFTANNININLGEGIIKGNAVYDLNNTKFEGNFELSNVNANYVAETLFESENQIFGNANGKVMINTQGLTNEEIINNLSGFVYFDIYDGRMPKLGSLEYLLHAGNIIKSGIVGFTLNNVLELLNLVKTGYFSNINGSCVLENGVAKNIEIYSTGENLSLYIKGDYNISTEHANMEILGKISKRISTIFGSLGNTSLNTLFRMIPGVSMLDFGRKDFIENVEKIPPFTDGEYESRTFQAIINGNINNKTGYVQSFKWVKQ